MFLVQSLDGEATLVGKFLGWEDFSPELIKKFIVELFGHVGSFSGNLVFS